MFADSSRSRRRRSGSLDGGASHEASRTKGRLEAKLPGVSAMLTAAWEGPALAFTAPASTQLVRRNRFSDTFGKPDEYLDLRACENESEVQLSSSISSIVR